MMNEETGTPEPQTLPPATREAYPFWGYQDLAILAGLALPSLMVAIAVVKLLGMLAPGSLAAPAVGVLLLQFIAFGLWFFCLNGLFRLRYNKPFWPSLAWIRPDRGMFLFIALGPVLALVVVFLGAALRTPDIEMPMKELLNDRLSLALVGIFAVTLGPLCEELAFRGFLLPLLARSLGAVVAVLLTAVIFSAMHGPQYAWSWQHLVLITLAGAVFGWVRLGSGSTAATVVVHAGYNLTFFVAYMAQWRELPTQW